MPSSSRLQLVFPPPLVDVRDVDGRTRSALLFARRDDRCYVQVSRSAGDNVLRWLPTADVAPARSGRPVVGLLPAGPARLRPPRAER